MDHTRIVYQQVARLDDDLFIVDKVFARAAANQDELHEILVRVHHARMRAGIRPYLADIQQLRLVLSGKNRLDFFLYKTLHVQAGCRHSFLQLLSLFYAVITGRCALYPLLYKV